VRPVISGNCKIKLALKALVVIVSKLFYLKDNDLVVNTRSMYQGTPRLTPLQYFFDHATDTDPFHYFKNEGTNTAMLRALQAVGDGQMEGFTRIQQRTLLETERNVVLNPEGGQVFTNTVTGTQPIVVLLPGIMGSSLSQDGATLDQLRSFYHWQINPAEYCFARRESAPDSGRQSSLG
jgi:hypothetical protein